MSMTFVKDYTGARISFSFLKIIFIRFNKSSSSFMVEDTPQASVDSIAPGFRGNNIYLERSFAFLLFLFS